MKYKNFLKLGMKAFLLSFVMSSAFSNNNIDSFNFPYNKDKAELKNIFKENIVFLEKQKSGITDGVSVFVVTDDDNPFHMLVDFLKKKMGYKDTRKSVVEVNSSGDFAFFMDKRFQNSGGNNILIGINDGSDKFKGISSFLKSKDRQEAYVFFHEFGHFIFNNFLLEQIDKFEKEEGKLSIQDWGLINESFADMFAYKMLLIKYPDLNSQLLKDSLISFRTGNNDYAHRTFPALSNSQEIADKKYKSMDDLISDCFEVSKNSFFYFQMLKDFSKDSKNKQNKI